MGGRLHRHLALATLVALASAAVPPSAAGRRLSRAAYAALPPPPSAALAASAAATVAVAAAAAAGATPAATAGASAAATAGTPPFRPWPPDAPSVLLIPTWGATPLQPVGSGGRPLPLHPHTLRTVGSWAAAAAVEPGPAAADGDAAAADGSVTVPTGLLSAAATASVRWGGPATCVPAPVSRAGRCVVAGRRGGGAALVVRLAGSAGGGAGGGGSGEGGGEDSDGRVGVLGWDWRRPAGVALPPAALLAAATRLASRRVRSSNGGSSGSGEGSDDSGSGSSRRPLLVAHGVGCVAALAALGAAPPVAAAATVSGIVLVAPPSPDEGLPAAAAAVLAAADRGTLLPSPLVPTSLPDGGAATPRRVDFRGMEWELGLRRRRRTPLPSVDGPWALGGVPPPSWGEQDEERGWPDGAPHPAVLGAARGGLAPALAALVPPPTAGGGDADVWANVSAVLRGWDLSPPPPLAARDGAGGGNGGGVGGDADVGIPPVNDPCATVRGVVPCVAVRGVGVRTRTLTRLPIAGWNGRHSAADAAEVAANGGAAVAVAPAADVSWGTVDGDGVVPAGYGGGGGVRTVPGGEHWEILGGEAVWEVLLAAAQGRWGELTSPLGDG